MLVAAAGRQARLAARHQRVLARVEAPRRTWRPRRLVRTLQGRLSGRHADRDTGALADVVDAITAALAAGIPTADALDAAATAAPPALGRGLGEAVAAIRGGMAVAAALDRWAATPAAPPGAALLAAAFAIARTTGSDPAVA